MERVEWVCTWAAEEVLPWLAAGTIGEGFGIAISSRNPGNEGADVCPGKELFLRRGVVMSILSAPGPPPLVLASPPPWLTGIATA
jgi:hypothetical protein